MGSCKNRRNRVVFVTASNSLYGDVCNYCAYCAKKYGKFDKVAVYDVDSMIDDEYRLKHKDILQKKRGAGLWLWKVYFIEKALREECDEGDVLFYADAASFFFKRVKPVIDNMSGDIYAVNVPFVEEEFTKRETIDLMGLDKKEFTKSPQFHASFMAFRKTPFTIKFIEEWKKLCEDVRLISSDDYLGMQSPTFVAHRNDQSIFSLLCKKYGVKPSADPSQYGITGYGNYNGATRLEMEMTPTSLFCIMLHKQREWGNTEKIKCWLRVYKRFMIIACRWFKSKDVFI